MLSTVCSSLALFAEADPIWTSAKAFFIRIDFSQRRFLKRTIEESHLKFNVRCHRYLFPNLVDHLQVVVAQLNAQQVVHASGSLLYVSDLEGVNDESDLSSSQHQEPLPLLRFFDHLNFLLEFRVRDPHEAGRKLGFQGLELHSCTTVFCSCFIQVLYPSRLIDFGQSISDLSSMSRACLHSSAE